MQDSFLGLCALGNARRKQTGPIVLACHEIHLIKAIPSTKKALHRKTYIANQIFSRYYFSSSNVYVIEDPENQINNTIFNHNW